MKRRLGFALALLVACVSAQALASEGTASYLGTWTARLSYAQMINEGFDPRLAGSFRLVLRKNGTYTTFNSFDGPSHGRYRVSGRRIVFSNDVGCRAGGFLGEGVYTWAIARGRLRLVTVRLGGDPCGGRWQTLTYPLWKRK